MTVIMALRAADKSPTNWLTTGLGARSGRGDREGKKRWGGGVLKEGSNVCIAPAMVMDEGGGEGRRDELFHTIGSGFPELTSTVGSCAISYRSTTVRQLSISYRRFMYHHGCPSLFVPSLCYHIFTTVRE